LRLIPFPRKPGTMPPGSRHMKGVRHDSTPLFPDSTGFSGKIQAIDIVEVILWSFRCSDVVQTPRSTGTHGVSCIHQLRPIGPPLNPLECEKSQFVPVRPDCISVGPSQPTERQKTRTHLPDLIVILPDDITLCRPRTVKINQGYRYLG